MSKSTKALPSTTNVTYYVDEAGDGVLFGPRGRDRLTDADAPRYFMLGMTRCADDEMVRAKLESLRAELMRNPLYSSIYSMRPEAGKTARAFHAKDDHAEIRSKVFELITTLDFKFYAVIKDMRKVRDYVKSRNRMDAEYRYHPNELYDLTVRMLFKRQVHKAAHYQVVFARRGTSDRTAALSKELASARATFLREHSIVSMSSIDIVPAFPWDSACLQVTDYCLWALQRCYEKHESRFLDAIWPKVSLVQDVDDPDGPGYGRFLTRRGPPPNPEKIKRRWI